MSKELHFAAYKVSAEKPLRFTLGFCQQVLDALPISGNHDDGDDRHLPSVLTTHFGDGYVEALPQTVFETLKNVPLFLKRMSVLDVKLKRQQSDDGHQAKTSCDTFSVTNASMTSPLLRSLKFAIPKPHSCPERTSLTSSLKRRNEPTLPE